MTEARFVMSPVDYEAWRKGYCPPSEHVLIDQLQFRGARVVLSSDAGPTAYWLVVRGDNPIKGRAALAIMQQIEDVIDTLTEAPASEVVAEDNAPSVDATPPQSKPLEPVE